HADDAADAGLIHGPVAALADRDAGVGRGGGRRRRVVAAHLRSQRGRQPVPAMHVPRLHRLVLHRLWPDPGHARAGARRLGAGLLDEPAGPAGAGPDPADAGLVRRLAAAAAGTADALGAGAEAVAGGVAGVLDPAEPSVVSVHAARTGLGQRQPGR